jgi:hypothetical protein
MVKRWFLRLVLVAVLAAGAYWAWRFLFPNQEQLIRNELDSLAKAASITPGESPLARLAKAQGLTTYFTTNAQVVVDIPGRIERTLNGREELLEAAGGARASLHSLNVKLLDVQVLLGPDKQSADASMTLEATVPGESVPEVQQVKASLTKVGGEWLIQHAETVRVLR